ncbi:MAG TPA: hypothetical protein DEB69_00185 [Candidatus Komeilibacteria bacterium]|nr:MAG: hypothetical protein A2260_01965 [Candidatus Komeilibacteria bacterium RIFOXYA2_FULL_45_9]HBV01824.1 hypothetical protein [Candidatus Komeilibacteria bacterium]
MDWFKVRNLKNYEKRFMKIFRLHKHQKRIYQKEYFYSITIVTQDRFPYFKDNKIFQKVIKLNIKLAKQVKKCAIYCYNIVDNHCQLMIKQKGQYNISQIVQFIKRNSSQDINKILGYNKFWKINKSDANAHWRLTVDNRINRLKRKFDDVFDNADFPKFKWQKSFHHRIIYSEGYFENAFNYIIGNREIHRERDKLIK